MMMRERNIVHVQQLHLLSARPKLELAHDLNDQLAPLPFVSVDFVIPHRIFYDLANHGLEAME